jgi:hypothetical protein
LEATYVHAHTVNEVTERGQNNIDNTCFIAHFKSLEGLQTVMFMVARDVSREDRFITLEKVDNYQTFF